MMKVALHLPKNRYTTSITTKNVIAIVSTNELMVLMILSDVFTITSILTSEGRFFCKFGSISITLLEMFTEFAPDCFCTIIIPPFFPLLKVSLERSSRPSWIVATSFKYTGLPLFTPTTRCFISSALANSFCTRNE